MTDRDAQDARGPRTPGGRRHHYLDWLRIGAFLLLILYHAGRAFFPDDPWHINDPVGSVALRDTMDLIARWRLPLLFENTLNRVWPGRSNGMIGDLAIPYRNALTVPIAWFAILSLTALAARFLDVDSAAKRYLNRAVYPLYIVHQTIALGIVYLVVPLDWNVSMKFGVTAVGTFALSLALYHFGIRRMGRAGVVFGLEGKLSARGD